MAGNPEIRCVGPSYHLADRKSAVQRAVNLYMREVEGLGEARTVVMDSAPGLTLDIEFFLTIRCQYTTEARRFVVAGPTLFEISGGTLARGTLATSSGRVSMIHGRDQLVIVDGPNGYVFDLRTNTLAQITDPDWRGSYDVSWVDGYFVFVDPDTDQFYLSAIDNAAALDGLDFTSADSQPDNIVTHRVIKHELVFFGDLSGEHWVDSGGADFPFVRYSGTPFDVGIVGQRAAIEAAETLFFIGRTKRGRGIVYQLVGHQPQRCSTRAVEEALTAEGVDLSAATMWAYQSLNGEFLGVNAPGMETTWVYDVAAKQWHERGEWVDGAWQPLRIDHVVALDGVTYATAGTKSYVVDPAAYTLAGDPLVRERTWPHLLNPSAEPISYSSLQLHCTTGQGGQVTLEVSNDGGSVFGPPLARSLGATGRRMQPVRWMPLGSSQDRVYRLRCSDAVPLTIHGANVEAH